MSRLVDLAEKLERGEIQVSDINLESELVALALRTVASGDEFKDGLFGNRKAAKEETAAAPIDKLSVAQRESVIQGLSSYLRGSPDLIPEVERFLHERTGGEEQDDSI